MLGINRSVQKRFRDPPKFPDKPKIRQAGKSVIFEVILQAAPAPELRWTKGGVEIKSGGRFKTGCQTTGSQHLLSLEINPVTADDGGEYLVTAKNRLGDSTATINLNIGAPKSHSNGKTFSDDSHPGLCGSQKVETM
ncbi:immunoglobulin I-set domain protein [Opisthorchis viverrini]|uniref:Immunoglobulin I-set domain protein n=1 Tax=Opisthorchis viverrini TaxID=6198 RepID=A0A1S8X9D1_OPIVI|nr:immunoglobulin I-set domain protein [Opisthorchis viverrini]